jgi:hypothetical protein
MSILIDMHCITYKNINIKIIKTCFIEEIFINLRFKMNFYIFKPENTEKYVFFILILSVSVI